MQNYDDELTVHELLKMMDVPMIELEPYLLEVKKQKYPCSISGLYQWINEITRNKSIDDLDHSNFSWILAMRIVNDTNYQGLLKDGILDFLEQFIDIEMKKIVDM